MQLKTLCARASSIIAAILLTLAGVIVVATAASALTTITQVSPTSNSTTVSGSTTFTDQLAVTGNSGTVTFTTSTATTGLVVSSSGAISTTGGPLLAGTYSANGTDSDGTDSGNWSYSLVVGAISQATPESGTTTVSGSSTFTDQLAVTGNDGAVTFTTGATTTGLVVSDLGAVSTTGGSLAPGMYTANGADGDANGDSGTWTYSLKVTGPLVQTSPTTGATSTVASASFQPGSIVVTGNVGPVTFVTTVPSSALSASSTGTISTTGSLLPSVYTVAGTDSDANGDTGTWTYSLTVNAIAESTLVQTSPSSGSTTTPDSAGFSPPALTVENGQGTVTFTTTTPSTGLSVTSDGVISVAGNLSAGTYTVSGTDRDPRGDTGTWIYSLTVTNIFTTVTFMPNGGTGTMAEERQNQPSPLAVNAFTRAGYSFVDWNTEADGSGVSYANGASYPFTANVTLYARWKKGKVPFHEVTFESNGGQGAAAVERDNTATALSPVAFTRAGYVFVNWNTKANGAGRTFDAGATYSFRASMTLFAQWKKRPHKVPVASFVVTFAANGGRGSMAREVGRKPTALEGVAFTRVGYTFTHWNTSPNGSGNDYANRGLFPFTRNSTLYAQWHRNKVATPVAVDGSAAIGPFAPKSASLSSSLDTEIESLAATAKAHHDTKVLLMGYGDQLSKADELNETVWAANISLSQDRANAVASYLTAQLAALGDKSCSVSTEGNGSVIPGTAGETDLAKDRHVIAQLT